MSDASDIKNVELSVVVPVFEEEKGIQPFLDRLLPILRENTSSYEVIFVLDPGRDQTEQVIHDIIQKEPGIEVLIMTRRWGQAACTLAGIDHCRGQACVVIDVDLQDPPELIVELLTKWREGYEVVLAQRRSRKGETIPKRITAALGYWVINHISEVSIPPNSGDFRLMSRRVVDALGTLKETHGFLRGLVGYVGFRQTVVRYDRDERTEGRSKYSQITGSLRIGLNGIVAFSLKPLELATALGFIMAIFSFFIGIYYVLQKLFWNTDITPGLASTILMITFFGGVQLICLGIMGEYIGRIYDEVRDRPKYMIDRRLNRDGEETL